MTIGSSAASAFQANSFRSPFEHCIGEGLPSEEYVKVCEHSAVFGGTTAGFKTEYAVLVLMADVFVEVVELLLVFAADLDRLDSR